MNIQRHLFGAIGLVCLAIGFSLFLGGETSRQALSAILIRVGFLMSTIWLAWPQFESLKKRSSVAVLIGVVSVLLVVAIKPKLFPIAALLIVGVLFLNAAMRRFSASSRK